VYVFGGDFDNLYFEFSKQKCEISGETFSPTGKKDGTVTGKSVGEISGDGKEFTENFEYIFMPGGHEGKDTVVWKKEEDGIYRSTGKNTEGVKFTYELTVKSEKEYNSITTFGDGRTVVTKAELKEDGSIHAVDTGKTKNGDVVFIIKYKRSKPR
jgi:hypothetical protein